MRKREQIKKERSKGITLIALVITIIVLLILAGVSIATLTGENGILTQASKAGEKTKNATEKEQLDLACIAVMGENRGGEITKEQLETELKKYDEKVKVEDKSGDIVVTFPSGNKYTIGKDGTIEETAILIEEAKKKEKFDTKMKVEDTYGNIVVVPEGFKIAEDSASDVTQGVVIEDVENAETKGSQFVWIPVGRIYKNEAKTEYEDITLGRYMFANGKTDKGAEGNILPEGEPIEYTLEFKEEDSTDTEHLLNRGNTIAKNINAFKNSVNINNGYYIGRYEAKTKIERSETTDSLDQVVIKKDGKIYNYVTQNQAADLSRQMYIGKSFESDLINSYAWDTAIVFLQIFDNRNEKTKLKEYSLQYSLNLENIAINGTCNLEIEKQDKICNIWDMASNCREWTTETPPNAYCVKRGGCYTGIGPFTSHRNANTTATKGEDTTFRPILIM